MSTSSPDPRLSLEVRCADSATEVFVIDGQFNLRERGIGYLKTLLEPGLYKVKVRVGFETQEQSVILRDHDHTIDIPRINFVSPAPLSQTSKTHEFQMQAAADRSRKTDLSVGQGSSIFIFVRDWTSDTPPSEILPSYPNPGQGLSLRDLEGNVIADLTTQGKQSHNWEPWAGCNVEVNPGRYLLRLETPWDVNLEQTIVASSGWQTQVFMLPRNYGEEADSKRADLLGAAILLARQGQGFDPDNETARLAELARLGLCNGRRVLSDEVLRMLANKFENPMLGILAAHLLLLDEKPDLGLLKIVMDNLRSLLPGSHPDVEALSLVLDPNAAYTFDVPPMVRKGWSLIVSATAKRPDIIPDDSIAAKIATNLWGSDPWLIWTNPKQTAGQSEPDANLESAPMVGSLINLVEAALRTRFGAASEQAEVTSATDRPESPFAAISATGSEGTPDKPQPPVIESMSLAVEGELSGGQSFTQPDEDEITKLVQSLNIPRKNLERMIEKLRADLSASNE
jgi:hypothetical protein